MNSLTPQRLSVTSPLRSPMRSPLRKRPTRKGLSEEQILTLRDTFALLDMDNSGIVNLKAISSEMKTMGLDSKQPVVVWLLSDLANVSNEVNFEQFLAAFEAKMCNSGSREAAEKLFEALDDEKKGTLQVEKLKKVAKELGELETEVQGLVKRSGASGEEITKEEFCALMEKGTF